MKRTNRSVNTHFWADNYSAELDPIEKLLFLYLLTNDQTNMLGCYEMRLRQIALDTGIDKDMILKIIDRFKKDQKAEYFEGYVIVYNFPKHQSYNPNMLKSAAACVNSTPESIRLSKGFERLMKGFRSLHKDFETLCESFVINEREIEREREIENEIENEGKSDSVDYEFFLNEWNQVYQTNLKMTPAKRKQIRQRLKTYSKQQLIEAIHKRSHDHWLKNEGSKHRASWEAFWRNDEKVERYLHARIEDLQKHANNSNKNRKRSGGEILTELFEESRAGYQ